MSNAARLNGVFDLAVVGAGIVGLAHALAAARLGKRVVVIDRDARANGASIRNFGFVTVSGQGRGAPWRRARRSRDVWNTVAPLAGIAVEQRGLLLTLRFPQSVAVAEAFMATEMAQDCRLLDADEVRRRFAPVAPPGMLGALHSARDLRVESRLALPRLAAWLEVAHGVVFQWRTAVVDVDLPRIRTSRGIVEAGAAVVCPGDDLSSLYPEVMEAHGVRRCSLSMLRLADPGMRLGFTVMSDLSLARYAGYAALGAASPLRESLAVSHAAALETGVHLIAAQGSDGQLIVGDSHDYDDVAEPFQTSAVEALILAEFEAGTGMVAPPVAERWRGSYAWSPTTSLVVEAPASDVRVVVVTSGNGASTAFAVGEEVIGELYDVALENVPLVM